MQHQAIATLLNRCSNQERLTREEESNLIQKCQQTVIARERQDCLGRLIEDNLVYLYSLVQKFNYGPRLSEEDAFCFAMERTIKAIEKFDVSRGVRLATYLQLQIRDEIQSKCAKYGGAISIPKRWVGRFFEEELEADDWVNFEEDVSDPGLIDALREALSTLSEAEQYVIQSSFFEKVRVQDAADQQGWSASKFHKIKRTALDKLKEQLTFFQEPDGVVESEPVMLSQVELEKESSAEETLNVVEADSPEHSQFIFTLNIERIVERASKAVAPFLIQKEAHEIKSVEVIRFLNGIRWSRKNFRNALRYWSNRCLSETFQSYMEIDLYGGISNRQFSFYPSRKRLKLNTS